MIFASILKFCKVLPSKTEILHHSICFWSRLPWGSCVMRCYRRERLVDGPRHSAIDYRVRHQCRHEHLKSPEKRYEASIIPSGRRGCTLEDRRQKEKSRLGWLVSKMNGVASKEWGANPGGKEMHFRVWGHIQEPKWVDTLITAMCYLAIPAWVLAPWEEGTVVASCLWTCNYGHTPLGVAADGDRSRKRKVWGVVGKADLYCSV